MNESLKVLLVEDDPDVRLGCEQALQLEGFPTRAVASAEAARPLIGPDFRGIVVSDIRLPGKDGMQLMRDMLAVDRELPVVLITGHGDINLAVQAMKDGAYDFIQKPFPPEHLVDVVRRALEKRRLVLENRALRRRLDGADLLAAKLVGLSAAMARLRSLVAEVAGSNADVLLHGETGTGKELVARCLHEASPRRHGNFVAINCGGMSETLFDSEIFGHEAGAYTGAAKRRVGKIEYANGGTLFLDEIETMPIPMQIKLLRVLQERTLERLGSNTSIPVDCRIVAATKADLLELSQAGRFRADLYYRLSVVTLPLPPLRERREDIPLLFEHFVLQAAARHGRPAPAFDGARNQLLMTHHWPGNVRELRNVADRCVLGIEHMAPPFRQGRDSPLQPFNQTVEAFERALLAEALRLNQGSLAKSAAALGLPKTTLHDKIRKHGLADLVG